MDDATTIEGPYLQFERTGYACPEQYDVFDENHHQVGYIRFRWGTLTCCYPDWNGECIYEKSVGGPAAGIFESDEQRDMYLRNIAVAIYKTLDREKEAQD